jgi:hypothetical protein
LITRYYRGEEPYVRYFLKFHRSLGIKEFLIIVQSQVDFEVIFQISKTYSDCFFSIHLSHVIGSADGALIKLPMKQYPSMSTYSMLIDIDEFLVFDQSCSFDRSYNSIKVNWLMTSSRNHHIDNRKAFYIPIFKMIAKNECIVKIKNPHEFLLKDGIDSQDCHALGDSCGLYLLHHWCRSFDDVIIKSSAQNISNNPKNIDVLKNGFLYFIEKNELPRRFRYAAFLESQETTANIVSSNIYAPEYSDVLERSIVGKILDPDLRLKLKAFYCEYFDYAISKAHLFPKWPHKVSVNQVCETLPSLWSIRDA